MSQVESASNQNDRIWPARRRLVQQPSDAQLLRPHGPMLRALQDRKYDHVQHYDPTPSRRIQEESANSGDLAMAMKSSPN
jgi:hypothetical protein